MIISSSECNNYILSVISFSLNNNSFNSLIKKLNQLNEIDYGNVTLYHDKFPNFYFIIKKENNKQINGGLIYNESTNTWGLHT